MQQLTSIEEQIVEAVSEASTGSSSALPRSTRRSERLFRAGSARAGSRLDVHPGRRDLVLAVLVPRPGHGTRSEQLLRSDRHPLPLDAPPRRRAPQADFRRANGAHCGCRGAGSRTPGGVSWPQVSVNGGGGGIRTPGGLPHVGFQNRCIQPGSATPPHGGCRGRSVARSGAREGEELELRSRTAHGPKVAQGEGHGRRQVRVDGLAVHRVRGPDP